MTEHVPSLVQMENTTAWAPPIRLHPSKFICVWMCYSWSRRMSSCGRVLHQPAAWHRHVRTATQYYNSTTLLTAQWSPLGKSGPLSKPFVRLWMAAAKRLVNNTLRKKEREALRKKTKLKSPLCCIFKQSRCCVWLKHAAKWSDLLLGSIMVQIVSLEPRRSWNIKKRFPTSSLSSRVSC